VNSTSIAATAPPPTARPRRGFLRAEWIDVCGTRAGAAIQRLLLRHYAHRFRGAAAEPLGAFDADWPGRSAVAWATGLSRSASSSRGAGFDDEIKRQIAAAGALDRMDGRRSPASAPQPRMRMHDAMSGKGNEES
jgi:hypothetical protein